jgi:carboxylesterase
MGEYLADRGMTVSCPLLPGHGTSAEDLTRIKRQAWIDEAESALRKLQERCRVVFVGGLSLGGLLTLWLGNHNPRLAGLLVMAPAVKLQSRMAATAVVLRYVLKYEPFAGPGDTDLGTQAAIERAWSYDRLPLYGAGEIYLLLKQVRRNLPRIHQPILIIQGRRDGRLAPEAAQIVHDEVNSADKTIVWLENSGHNLLIDGEREAVFARCYHWMTTRAKGHRQPAHA